MGGADSDRSRARAAHAVRPGGNPVRVAAAVAGLSAAAVAAALGTATLIAPPAPMPSEPTTMRHITVSRTPLPIPLSDHQVVALLDRKPDYGPLGDPQRRASCLTGLGYPATVQVLGAQPVEVADRAGVLMVLPNDTPATLAVLVVASTCNSTNAGLLAKQVVRRR